MTLQTESTTLPYSVPWVYKRWTETQGFLSLLKYARNIRNWDSEED